MYRGLAESLVVILLAALGIADAWRLSNLVRAGGTFHDVIGPDRYLGVISAGLFICGVWNLIAGLKSRKLSRGKRGEREGSQFNQVVLVAFLLFVYTFAIPMLGYLLATSIFFPVIYFIFGVRPWPKSIIVGLITAGLFYAIFAHFAEMPLPKGLFEKIL
jgi:putative tricarboxylic transport membrane protein